MNQLKSVFEQIDLNSIVFKIEDDQQLVMTQREREAFNIMKGIFKIITQWRYQKTDKIGSQQGTVIRIICESLEQTGGQLIRTSDVKFLSEFLGFTEEDILDARKVIIAYFNNPKLRNNEQHILNKLPRSTVEYLKAHVAE